MTESSSTPTGQKRFRPRWSFLIGVALLILVADQSTKFLAVKNLTTAMQSANATTLGQQVHVWLSSRQIVDEAKQVPPLFSHWWSWRYDENTGAAWSFAARWPKSARVPFFDIISVLAIGLIAFYYRRLKTNQKLLGMALALVMGGAIGNLTDRLVRGYVIDFIAWHWNDPHWLHPNLHWPTFNIADSCISVGVALIALDSLIVWAASKRQPAAGGSARRPTGLQAGGKASGAGGAADRPQKGTHASDSL